MIRLRQVDADCSSPHAEKEDGRGRSILELAERFGTLLHGHVTRERTKLEPMARQLFLERLERRCVLREYEALGCKQKDKA